MSLEYNALSNNDPKNPVLWNSFLNFCFYSKDDLKQKLDKNNIEEYDSKLERYLSYYNISFISSPNNSASENDNQSIEGITIPYLSGIGCATSDRALNFIKQEFFSIFTKNREKEVQKLKTALKLVFLELNSTFFNSWSTYNSETTVQQFLKSNTNKKSDKVLLDLLQKQLKNLDDRIENNEDRDQKQINIFLEKSLEYALMDLKKQLVDQKQIPDQDQDKIWTNLWIGQLCDYRIKQLQVQTKRDTLDYITKNSIDFQKIKTQFIRGRELSKSWNSYNILNNRRFDNQKINILSEKEIPDNIWKLLEFDNSIFATSNSFTSQNSNFNSNLDSRIKLLVTLLETLPVFLKNQNDRFALILKDTKGLFHLRLEHFSTVFLRKLFHQPNLQQVQPIKTSQDINTTTIMRTLFHQYFDLANNTFYLSTPGSKGYNKNWPKLQKKEIKRINSLSLTDLSFSIIAKFLVDLYN
jgi:hypothetical protein